MSDISQYQNVFRIAKRDGEGGLPRTRSNKRNRHPISCSMCRLRKLKCDRQYPCLSCIKRGEGGVCNYGDTEKEVDSTQSKGVWPSEAQKRLQRLEEMVTSLIQQGSTGSESSKDNKSQSTPSSDSRSDPTSDVLTLDSPKNPSLLLPGRLDSVGSETTYKGSTNWESILENIHDLQDHIAPDIESGEEESGPLLILDTTQPLSLEDTCNALPSKNVADQLMLIYFDARHLEPPFLHKQKFLREYEAFWVDPSSQSFLWISMLFSLLCVGCRVANASGKEIFDFPNDIASRAFMVKSGQALVTGQYYKARQYSVEAAMLYTHSKLVQGAELDADSWMLIGICIRIALRMGYHRDPRHLAGISAFDGEMRRRIFALLQMYDSLNAFQAGLPAIIHEEECDTEPPHNLYDEDFDEDTEVLPAPRPSNEATPILFWRTKSFFVRMLRRTVMLPGPGKIPLYDKVMKMDKELRDVRARIPEPLRLQVDNLACTNDTGTALIHKLNIELAFLKCVCNLHRTYLTYQRDNPTYAYSRKACVEAALRILQCQRELMAASMPGGRIVQSGTFRSNVLRDDYLRAAMITCVDLYESYIGGEINTSEERKEQAAKYDTLQRAFDIWQATSRDSRDAQRASAVMAVMLSRIPRPREDESPQSAPPDLSTLAVSPVGAEAYLSNSINAPPNGNNDVHGTTNAQTLTYDFNTPGPLNDMLKDPRSLDWGFVDEYLFERNGVVDYTVDWQSWN